MKLKLRYEWDLLAWRDRWGILYRYWHRDKRWVQSVDEVTDHMWHGTLSKQATD